MAALHVYPLSIMFYGLLRGKSFAAYCHSGIAHYVRAYVRNIYVRDAKIERAKRKYALRARIEAATIAATPPPVTCTFEHSGGPRELVAHIEAEGRVLGARHGWEAWRTAERTDMACKQGLKVLAAARGVSARKYLAQYRDRVWD